MRKLFYSIIIVLNMFLGHEAIANTSQGNLKKKSTLKIKGLQTTNFSLVFAINNIEETLGGISNDQIIDFTSITSDLYTNFEQRGSVLFLYKWNI